MTTNEKLTYYCGAPIQLKQSRYGPFWSCTKWPDCDGKVGAHPDGSPMGTPADPKTAAARIAAHKDFDDWWRSKNWSRARAYKWLQDNGPKPHIAEMTIEECWELANLIDDYETAF